MPNVPQIKIGNTTYKLKDVDLREEFNNLKSAFKNNLAVEQQMTFEEKNIVQGSYNAQGEHTSSSIRIRINEIIPVCKGMAIHYIAGTTVTHFTYGKFDSSMTFISESSWMTGTKDITIDWDGYMIVIFRKSSTSATVSPSEYDAKFELESKSSVIIDGILEIQAIMNNGVQYAVNGNVGLIPCGIEWNCYYNDSGTRISSDTYSTLDYISIEKIETVTVGYDSSVSGVAIALMFFDSSKNVIRRIESSTVISDIPVDKGTKYIRVTFKNDNAKSVLLLGKASPFIEITPEWTDGYYVSKTNGNLVEYSGASASQYIDVEGYEYLCMCAYSAPSGVEFAFYDENKQFVTGDVIRGTAVNHTISIPFLAKYLRTSTYNSQIDYFYIRLVTYENTSGNYFGKYFSILGDSISTFNGFIPSGNAYWYPHGDVTMVSDLWWYKLINHFHGKLLIDEAWSGSQISGTAASAANNDSRCKNLGTETQDPDVIIVYMGTNDYDHNVALGTYDGHDTIPSTVETFSDAYAVTLDKILTKYKHAEVWCCTLQPMERHGQTGFPEKNNIGLTPEDYNEVIRKIANAMNCKVLEHSQCGITYYNMPEYFEDWSGSKEHPNKEGHTLIARHDIRFML